MSALAIMGIILGTLVTIALMPVFCLIGLAAVYALAEWLSK